MVKLKTLSKYICVRLLQGTCVLDSNLMLMFFPGEHRGDVVPD